MSVSAKIPRKNNVPCAPPVLTKRKEGILKAIEKRFEYLYSQHGEPFSKTRVFITKEGDIISSATNEIITPMETRDILETYAYSRLQRFPKLLEIFSIQRRCHRNNTSVHFAATS
jgi:dTDP-4-dehydrorhamnose reductase